MYQKKAGLRISRRFVVFWSGYVKSSILFLYREEEDGKAGTRGIWRCFVVFWNVRSFMTGT